MENKKTWLITGVSKGLGNEIAKIVHQNGEQVIGFVRNEADKILLENSMGGIKIYLIDLQKIEKIKDTITDIIKNFGSIDFLVNNAGYGMFGLFEEVSLDELKQQFEVNVFARWHLINNILPYMRKQKSGVIVQISSRLGILAGIGNSAYSAAEFAIEGMSESLADEVKSFGIQVALVEPGPMRTSFFGSSITFAENNIKDYQDAFGNLRESFRSRNGKQKGDPTRIAQIIYNEITKKEVPFRIPLTNATLDALQQKAEDYQKLHEEWIEKAKSVDVL